MFICYKHTYFLWGLILFYRFTSRHKIKLNRSGMFVKILPSQPTNFWLAKQRQKTTLSLCMMNTKIHYIKQKFTSPFHFTTLETTDLNQIKYRTAACWINYFVRPISAARTRRKLISFMRKWILFHFSYDFWIVITNKNIICSGRAKKFL